MWGPKLETLQNLELETNTTPAALRDRPQLAGVVLEIAEAYDVMIKHRTAGIMSNPITLTDIRSYVELYGPPSVPIPVFVEMIHRLDAVALTKDSKNGNQSPS